MDTVLIVFGASGNLSELKLIPSILRLRLYQKAEIVLYSRNITSSFLHEKTDNLQNDNLKIVKGEYTDNKKLGKLIQNKSHIVFYLCIPSHKHFETVHSLNALNRNIVVALEKPFFTCIEEVNGAMHLNNLSFKFIDHYLLKPLILSLPKIKKDVEKHMKNIINVKIYALERELVGDRVAFDKDGIFKDMVFTHLFNVFEKIFGDGSLKDLQFKKVHLRGQYEDYEFKESESETFSLSVFEYKNKFNVIFVAGKGLNKKETKVVVKKSNGIIVFDIYPNNNIMMNDKTLVSDKTISYCIEKAYSYDDYDLVLHSLINDIYFDTVSMDRIKETYKLLGAVESEHSPLFVYKKNVYLPNEAHIFFK